MKGTAIMLAALLLAPAFGQADQKYIPGFSGGMIISLGKPGTLSGAAESGDLEQVKRLVAANKAVVNVVDKESGLYPLEIACRTGRTEVAAFLIDSGAQVKVHDAKQNGPMYWAVWSTNTKTTELLLNRGADVNESESGDETPLFLAAFNEDEPTVALLIAHKADVNHVTNMKQTVLHKVAQFNDKADVARDLVKAGANLKAADVFGAIPADGLATRIKMHQPVSDDLVKCLQGH